MLPRGYRVREAGRSEARRDWEACGRGLPARRLDIKYALQPPIRIRRLHPEPISLILSPVLDPGRAEPVRQQQILERSPPSLNTGSAKDKVYREADRFWNGERRRSG